MASNFLITSTEQQVLKLYLDNPELLIGSENLFLSDIGSDVYNTLESLIEEELSFTKLNFVKYGKEINSELNENVFDNLNSIEVHVNDYPHHVKELTKFWYAEYIDSEILKNISGEVNSKDKLDISNLKSYHTELGEAIQKMEVHKSSTYEFTRGEETEYMTQLFQERQNGQIKKYNSGWPKLDKLLYNNSMMPNEISIIFGNSGNGKTTFKNNWVEVRRFRKYATIDISLEMSIESDMDTKLGIRSGVNRDQINGSGSEGYIDTTHVEKILLKDKKQAHKNKYLYINTPTYSLAELDENIPKYKRRIGVNLDSYVMVFIDLLTMCKEFNKSKNKANDYEEAMNYLLEISKKHKVHICGVVQPKRPSDKISVKDFSDIQKFKPTIELLKNSGAIEERARVVFSIFRPYHYMKRYSELRGSPEFEVQDDIMEVDILKQNNGDLGGIKFMMHPESGKLYMLEGYEKGDTDV